MKTQDQIEDILNEFHGDLEGKAIVDGRAVHARYAEWYPDLTELLFEEFVLSEMFDQLPDVEPTPEHEARLEEIIKRVVSRLKDPCKHCRHRRRPPISVGGVAVTGAWSCYAPPIRWRALVHAREQCRTKEGEWSFFEPGPLIPPAE